MELRNFMFPQTNFSEVRASSFGSAAETADLMRKASMIDLRKLGCPDDIFEFVLEKRSERRSIEQRDGSNFEPSVNRDVMQLRLSHALKN
ncbi:MAG: hypothetical protein WCC97_10805 [Candidatus Acidiferrales bacterium]